VVRDIDLLLGLDTIVLTVQNGCHGISRGSAADNHRQSLILGVSPGISTQDAHRLRGLSGSGGNAGRDPHVEGDRFDCNSKATERASNCTTFSSRPG
jgi:hypothetical protein